MDSVLARFLIPGGGAPGILGLGTQLLDSLPCRILRYDDLDEAAGLVAQQALLLPPAAPLADAPPPMPERPIPEGRPPSLPPREDDGDRFRGTRPPPCWPRPSPASLKDASGTSSTSFSGPFPRPA